MGGKSPHFQAELFQRLGDGVQRVNGLPDHSFGQGILGEHGDQVVRLRVDLNGPTRARVVAMPFASLAVTPSKGSEAHAPHTVHMPKGCGKVHPLLAGILADRAVKQGVDTGIGLVQKSDEIVLHHHLGVQTLLPVQRFQLHSNCVHRCMWA